jgi:hypothetical protein
MKSYEVQMQSYGSSNQRWPERQRAAASLKNVITATVGGSREFYRVVDMDLRRREYAIAMRETALRPARLKEMEKELVDMTEEAYRLKPIINAQIAALPVPPEERRIESTATKGLLALALDALTWTGSPNNQNAPSVMVEQHVVTDFGAFSTVRAPGGQLYRCMLFAVEDVGAGMKCESEK